MSLNNFNTNNNNLPTSNSPFIINLLNQQTSDPDPHFINYNEKYKNASPAMFRDNIIEQIMSVLIGKNKPNALLIGPAGVGKTKIIEELARRIENKDATILNSLLKNTIYELSLSNLIAGSGIVGALEEKIHQVIDFASDNDVILFIDEIHLLADPNNQIYSKIAQILKPALSRGVIKMIGATTTQEAKMLQEDPAFNRRFSRIIVDEFTKNQTIELLKHAKHDYMTHYPNIIIKDSLLPLIVDIADQYKNPGNHRPDTALTLLDRACADTIIARKQKEDKLQSDPAMLKLLKANPNITLNDSQIKNTALKIMTGHAIKTNFDEQNLKDTLSTIKGQDEIIQNLTKQLLRHDRNLFPKDTPLTFLFAGPSGVGKTQVTKLIAKLMTGVNPITLSMPEFHSPASINRIIGSPAGYVGSDSNSELPFDCLTTNPYQIILLDEFEKADRSVQRLFMGAFDEGYIKTAKGAVIDFSKTIIIATTNANHTTNASKAIGFINTTNKNNEIQSLSNWFDIELLNRFSKIYTFNNISSDIFKEIIQNDYKSHAERLNEQQRSLNLPSELTDQELNELCCEYYIEALGARPAKRAVEEYIENLIERKTQCQSS